MPTNVEINGGLSVSQPPVEEITGEMSDRVIRRRVRHGFRNEGQHKGSVQQWSQGVLRSTTREGDFAHVPLQQAEWPKNLPIYEFIRRRLADIGFDYGLKRDMKCRNGKNNDVVEFVNWPTVGGRCLTLADLCVVEPRELDDHDRLVARHAHVGESVDFNAKRVLMNATGVGYKGFVGVSWRASVEPVVLPAHVGTQINALARAIFLFHDAVRELYPESTRLQHLLTHKKPDRILPIMMRDSVDIVRPDIVVVRDKDGTFRPVVTELESAPAGQGMAHAMQVGYGLEPTVMSEFVRYLAGRPFRIIATHEWGEYTWDQGVWVDQLRKRGVDAELWFDRPLDEVVALAAKWQMPPGMPSHMLAQWDTDFLGRLKATGFDAFVRGFKEGEMPEPPSGSALFRFAYFDNFSADLLRRIEHWANSGCSVINGHRFCLETKVLMAAAWEPEVVAWITERDGDAVGVLQRCLAETRLLSTGFVDLDKMMGTTTEVRPEGEPARNWWLTKFAAWDGKNQSWGSRSLAVGNEMAEIQWRESLVERLLLPHAVVAQHMILSHDYDVRWVGPDGRSEMLKAGKIRVTPFFLRMPSGEVLSVGTTGTWRVGTARIHGATDAVEGPIVFQG